MKCRYCGGRLNDKNTCTECGRINDNDAPIPFEAPDEILHEDSDPRTPKYYKLDWKKALGRETKGVSILESGGL